MTVTERPEVRRYCDDLLLALRMHDVPGPRIGELLTEVRSHLADSGEDPEHAFGSPVDYAAALAAGAPPEPRRERISTWARSGALFLGAWWFVEGALAVATGSAALVGPVPVLVAVAVGMATPWLVDRIAAPGGRLAVAGRIAGLSVLTTGAGAALALLGDRWPLTVPGALPLFTGLLLVLAGVLRGGVSADPVTYPLEPTTPARTSQRRDTARAHLVVWGVLALMAAASVWFAVVVDSTG